MAKKLILASMLMTVLSAGAVSFKQISTAPKFLSFCASPYCTAANPRTCGGCFCNLPDGICTREPIGP